MKTILTICLLAVVVAFVGCSSSTYNRNQDGSVVAKDGALVLTYAADGKTLVSESFIPQKQMDFISQLFGTAQTPMSPAALIQLLQGLAIPAK